MIKKVLYLGLSVILSIAISCERPKKVESKSIKWRAKSIKYNKLVYAFNYDSLPVKSGDTVLLNYDNENYYIANVAYPVRDTAYLDTYIDSSGLEQTYHYEAVNVVLLDSEVK